MRCFAKKPSCNLDCIFTASLSLGNSKANEWQTFLNAILILQRDRNAWPDDIILQRSAFSNIHLSFFYIFIIQIAFTSVVYPALILAYMGQAAYLSKHHKIHSTYQIGFYVSVPGSFLISLLMCSYIERSQFACYHVKKDSQVMDILYTTFEKCIICPRNIVNMAFYLATHNFSKKYSANFFLV